jgi:hypothetical protein
MKAIELVFTLAVVQGISKIDGIKEFFTQYLLSQTAQLTVHIQQDYTSY